MYKSILKTPYAQWAYRAIHYTAPLAAGLCGCATRAAAGPINNALDGVGTDVSSSATAIGIALLIWVGARILLDEHHSLNAGRIVGGAMGGLFVFAPVSLQTWMNGW